MNGPLGAVKRLVTTLVRLHKREQPYVFQDSARVQGGSTRQCATTTRRWGVVKYNKRNGRRAPVKAAR